MVNVSSVPQILVAFGCTESSATLAVPLKGKTKMEKRASANNMQIVFNEMPLKAPRLLERKGCS